MESGRILLVSKVSWFPLRGENKVFSLCEEASHSSAAAASVRPGWLKGWERKSESTTVRNLASCPSSLCALAIVWATIPAPPVLENVM